MLTIFCTKDTGGPNLPRSLPVCSKTHCKETELKVYTLLTAAASIVLAIAGASTFPIIIYQNLWHICTFAASSRCVVPAKMRPDLKHSPVRDHSRIYTEDQPLGFTNLSASRRLGCLMTDWFGCCENLQEPSPPKQSNGKYHCPSAPPHRW